MVPKWALGGPKPAFYRGLGSKPLVYSKLWEASGRLLGKFGLLELDIGRCLRKLLEACRKRFLVLALFSWGNEKVHGKNEEGILGGWDVPKYKYHISISINIYIYMSYIYIYMYKYIYIYMYKYIYIYV